MCRAGRLLYSAAVLCTGGADALWRNKTQGNTDNAGEETVPPSVRVDGSLADCG